ncbi:hypothetical protein [Fibrobacter sp. UBA4297]|uniref:hypothetical protein n=1 Tax=Fibrobacter sp. UBA4297 TaxID=1946536 RepID=UPI0025B7B087|nr:hypothetical protein [Fibrobacter sp. UBA4297]
MIRTAFLAILCSCAIALGQNANLDPVDYNKVKVNPADMAEFQDARNSLWLALKNGDVNKVDVALAFLSHEMIPESALDSLELLQINLLLERYDQAIPQFANMLMKGRKKVRYSFAYDSLFHYLRNETRFAAEYTDRSAERDQAERHMKLKGYMTEAAQANIKQEYKDLASIFADLHPFYHFFDKGFWTYLITINKVPDNDSLANIISQRVEDRVDLHQEMDTVAVKLMIERIQAFCEKYPESEYSEWLKNISWEIERVQNSYKRYRNYYEEKLYTGGIGLEAFLLGVSLSFTEGEFLLGVPVQISRLIVTPSMFLGGEYSDAFFITAGIDVYENKWLKIQPFAGGYDLFTAGLQVDYRFWMSKTCGSEFHDATYLTLKLRYMGIYNAPETKKEWHNRVYLGLGVHVW